MQSPPEQLVAEFLSEYQNSGVYLREHIAHLAQLAASHEPQIAEPAIRALFTGLAERLSDSFKPEAVSLYNRAFGQIIHAFRASPSGEALDRALDNFGIQTEEQLIERADGLRRVSRLALAPDSASKLRRAIILSRVTVGADVAVTSVIVQRIKQIFPGAEIVIVGGPKTGELFAGDPRVRLKEINYRRRGGMLDRLAAWSELCEIVRELTDDLQSPEYIIVDPDTRLTQLGLLPVTRARARSEPVDYLFFPSREYGGESSRSLAELTSDWLDEVFGDGGQTFPSVSLNREDVETASGLISQMRSARRGHIIAINFGVGENPAKRMSRGFEASLVAGLIERGSSIILDKGAGADEVGRADAIIAEAARLGRDGRPVRAIELEEAGMSRAFKSGDLDADILAWSGRIGMLAALIGQSDCYIGYDSAGAHIAAALGVPCIDLFAGFSSRRFLDRWRPTGRSSTLVVAEDGGADKKELLGEVLRLAEEALAGNQRIEN